MGRKYCKKCGWSRLLLDDPDKECPVCGGFLYPIDLKYVYDDFGIFKSSDIEKQFIEECVKSSPEFDPYLFEHCEEIYAEKMRPINEAWARVEAFQKAKANLPKCPTCQSTNIKKISGTSKALDTMVWGIFGSKRHKTFHCNNCGYEW